MPDGTRPFFRGFGLIVGADRHSEELENLIAHEIRERLLCRGLERVAGQVDTLVGILESFTRRKLEPRARDAFHNLLERARVILRVGRIAERRPGPQSRMMTQKVA